MSEEFQKHIFEAFVQEDAFNARTQYKGSGLGMSIVRQLVDMMGGSMDIKSELHVGTSIVVDLPFEIDKSAAERPKENLGIENQFDFSGIRVLLAEDNKSTLKLPKICWRAGE
jgi:hypothetical protein